MSTFCVITDEKKTVYSGQVAMAASSYGEELPNQYGFGRNPKVYGKSLTRAERSTTGDLNGRTNNSTSPQATNYSIGFMAIGKCAYIWA